MWMGRKEKCDCDAFIYLRAWSKQMLFGIVKMCFIFIFFVSAHTDTCSSAMLKCPTTNNKTLKNSNLSKGDLRNQAIQL